MREYKLVLFGSGDCGKSALVSLMQVVWRPAPLNVKGRVSRLLGKKAVRFAQDVFGEKYDPTIEDSYKKQVEVDGKQCMLEILDTAGTEQYSALRDLYMKNGQGFALIFSITSQSSFNDLTDYRDQIFRVKGSSNVPMVIVGHNCHLEDERVVGKDQGRELAQQWDNTTYIEASAEANINVSEIFYKLVRQINVMFPEKKEEEEESSCCIVL